MSKVWVIAKHSYWVNFRKPGFLLWTFGLPVLGGLALALFALLGATAVASAVSSIVPEANPIGLVDETGQFSDVPELFGERLQLFESEDAGRSALEADDIANLYIVGADYLTDGSIRVIRSDGASTLDVSREIVEAYLSDQLLRGAGIESEVRTRALRGIESISEIELNAAPDDEGEEEDFLATFFVPYLLGIFLVSSIFVASGYLLTSVTEEKSNRVVEILLSSVEAWQLLAGKVLGMGLLGLTQIVVWYGSAIILAYVATVALSVSGLSLLNRPSILILTPIYFVLGYTLYAVLMGASGALGTNQQEAQKSAGLFSMIAAAPFFLLFVIIANPNAIIARALSWFPLTGPMTMLLRLPFAEVPWIDVVVSIGLSTAAIPLAVWFGAKVFRTGILAYGKHLKWGEVLKMLRSA
ncbi:MAG: ABC transporter permease [Chloroflexi bacterium]|nr:ABC transporter permease [Chloroflexota bacterium]